ncbi:MAG: TolC family outer membrane protein [Rhodospirillaceae bacterium]|jgi:outer membrane protein|nr:TolC family outer membrane protein [Rhodospirillaceae bacterium]MBT5013975.1 TolC family outer membrane protein [Rhodospirillaceae bacterium]MBT5309666.1 TolC family outer membrane protein [Rhodospirillaceae bacterium]MBT7356276.1 TolC family outer membrane protein [Rhodospirillaceae bacterium]
MNSRFSIALGLSIIAVGYGLPTTGHSQTLEEALASAYSGNPTLLGQRANLRATDEGVTQALSGYRPTIAASGSSGYSEIESSTATDRNQQREPHSASVTLSQSIFAGGGTLAATRNADNSVLAERASLQGVEQDILLSAVSAFASVFRAQAVLDLTINNEQVLARQLEATRDRFSVGEITRTDVHQAEARLAGTTADRIKAEGDLKSARATYRNVIGETPGKLSRPDTTLTLPANFDEALKLATEDNPSVVAAYYTERAADNSIDAVKAELLPSLDLSGSASRSLNASGESTSINTYAAKMTLSVPLYQSGSVYSRLRAARQTASQRRRDLDQARRNAVEEVTLAWEDIQTVSARMISFRAQIKAAEVALEGLRQEAAVGSRTVLDVLDAEQELLDARVNLVGAERDQLVARFGLKSAVGELTAAHLQLPVDVYDSAKNYEDVRWKWFGGAIDKAE